MKRVAHKVHLAMFLVESVALSLVLMYPIFVRLDPIYKPITRKQATLSFKFASGQDDLLRKIYRSSLLYITQENTGLDDARSIILDHAKYRSGQEYTVEVPFPISGFRLDFRMRDKNLQYPELTSLCFGDQRIPVENLERPYYTVNPFPCYFYRPKYFVNGNEKAYVCTSLALSVVMFFALVWMLRRKCIVGGEKL